MSDLVAAFRLDLQPYLYSFIKAKFPSLLGKTSLTPRDLQWYKLALFNDSNFP